MIVEAFLRVSWPSLPHLLPPTVRLPGLCGVGAPPAVVQLCAMITDALWAALVAGVSGRGAPKEAFRARADSVARLSLGVREALAVSFLP